MHRKWWRHTQGRAEPSSAFQVFDDNLSQTPGICVTHNYILWMEEFKSPGTSRGFVTPAASRNPTGWCSSKGQGGNSSLLAVVPCSPRAAQLRAVVGDQDLVGQYRYLGWARCCLPSGPGRSARSPLRMEKSVTETHDLP